MGKQHTEALLARWQWGGFQTDTREFGQESPGTVCQINSSNVSHASEPLTATFLLLHNTNVRSSTIQCIQVYTSIYIHILGFPGGLVLKNPPVNAGAWVQSLDQEDTLEKEIASHSSFAWEILWKRSLAGYSPWGCKELLDVT